jgi:hypothetical protein
MFFMLSVTIKPITLSVDMLNATMLIVIVLIVLAPREIALQRFHQQQIP